MAVVVVAAVAKFPVMVAAGIVMVVVFGAG
jgi:hypothetical protein